jgi:hypothetical protein
MGIILFFLFFRARSYVYLVRFGGGAPEIAYGFAKAAAHFRQFVRAENKQADDKDDEKFLHAYPEHGASPE